MPSQRRGPERLNNPDFRDHVLPELSAATADVRMPFLGSLEYTPESAGAPLPQANSARRVRSLHQVPTVPPEPARGPAAAGGPVLLVDDAADTGWTLAVAARTLRRSGAEGVFPLVLAVQG